jgi:hypothetical protein
LKDSISNPKDRVKMDKLLRRRFEVQQEMASLEKEKRDLNDEISPLMNAYEVKSIDMGYFTATYVEGCSAHISKTALLDHGVGPDVIEECTSRTEFTTIQVRKKKEKGDDDDD